MINKESGDAIEQYHVTYSCANPGSTISFNCSKYFQIDNRVEDGMIEFRNHKNTPLEGFYVMEWLGKDAIFKNLCVKEYVSPRFNRLSSSSIAINCDTFNKMLSFLRGGEYESGTHRS